jgi:hypothetical protein
VREEPEVWHGPTVPGGRTGSLVAVSRNGRQRPARPRIEVRRGSATAEETAAIAAAIEQFLRDTAPPPAPARGVSPWLRAGLFEATGRAAGDPAPWGDPVRWGG